MRDPSAEPCPRRAGAPVDPRLARIAASLPSLIDPAWSVELFRDYDGDVSVVVMRHDADEDAADYLVAVERGALLLSGGCGSLSPLRVCDDAATMLACLAETIGLRAAACHAA